MTRFTRPLLYILGFLAVEFFLFTFVDRPVSDFMRGVDAAHPAFINFFRSITDFAKSKWYLWPSGFALIVCVCAARSRLLTEAQKQRVTKYGHNLFFFFSSIALSGLITDTLKPILGRARPVEMLREGLYGFRPFTFHSVWNSMPSGHTTTAATAAYLLIVFFPRGRWLWLAFGAILSISRVMVNAHYMSDIVAGMMVGILAVNLMKPRRTSTGMFPWLKVFFPLTETEQIARREL